MSLMEWILGKKRTPRQIMRRHKRSIERTIVQLNRERRKVENQEARLIRKMKTLARENRMDAVRILAKELIRTRSHVRKFYQMSAQMQSVSLRMTSMGSTQPMAEAMRGAGRMMTLMNARMDIPQIRRIMKRFATESEMFEMKDGVMSDAIDGVMEGDDDEAEQSELVSSILDEVGIEDVDKLGDGVGGGGGEELQSIDDLAARLANLKN